MAADEAVPVVIATILREEGATGVQTHVRELCGYLDRTGRTTTVVTPFSWGRLLTYPVFGLRFVLLRINNAAAVMWYLHWHRVFLTHALRRRLAKMGECVIYAQGQQEAQAALRARTGPQQRIVMAVHFKVSKADEWAGTMDHPIKRNGWLFRAVRRAERTVIPQVDGVVYVSEWARQALLSWLPEAAVVPSAIIGNFVTPMTGRKAEAPVRDLVTIGYLDVGKNHRFTLEVLAEAKRAGRILTLDVFGEGVLRHELLQLTRTLGLEDQVRFLGFRKDVREFLPDYRAYVHASVTETSSLAIMEAMASGLPIVAGATGPLVELLDDNVEGRFWPLDNPPKAAAILVDLLDSEPARSAAAEAASERFRRDYDVAVVAPRLLAFFAERART